MPEFDQSNPYLSSGIDVPIHGGGGGSGSGGGGGGFSGGGPAGFALQRPPQVSMVQAAQIRLGWAQKDLARAQKALDKAQARFDKKQINAFALQLRVNARNRAQDKVKKWETALQSVQNAQNAIDNANAAIRTAAEVNRQYKMGKATLAQAQAAYNEAVDKIDISKILEKSAYEAIGEANGNVPLSNRPRQSGGTTGVDPNIQNGSFNGPKGGGGPGGTGGGDGGVGLINPQIENFGQSNNSGPSQNDQLGDYLGQNNNTQVKQTPDKPGQAPKQPGNGSSCVPYQGWLAFDFAKEYRRQGRDGPGGYGRWVPVVPVPRESNRDGSPPNRPPNSNVPPPDGPFISTGRTIGNGPAPEPGRTSSSVDVGPNINTFKMERVTTPIHTNSVGGIIVGDSNNYPGPGNDTAAGPVYVLHVNGVMTTVLPITVQSVQIPCFNSNANIQSIGIGGGGGGLGGGGD